jgi:hypothetical protein
VQGTGAETFWKGLLQVKNVINFGIPQSKVPASVLNNFEHLTSLNLSQCYLDSRSIVVISETLKHNRVLTKLDLSYNAISSNIGRYLAKALRINVSLTILNLGHNDLHDDFCRFLNVEISKNQTLYEINMAGNPFTSVGADALMELIGVTALASFGHLDDNKNLSVTAREALKGTLGEFKNDYKLLLPIEETNPYGEIVILPWNLTNAIG